MQLSSDSFIPEELEQSSSRHIFFQRSDSTTFLGCIAPDSVHTPLAEALPLADRPHLLHPFARREEMFGIPKQPTNKKRVSVIVSLVTVIGSRARYLWVGDNSELLLTDQEEFR